MPDDPCVVILRGIPGSGKTTYAKTQYPDALIVSADHYFERTGEYLYDREHIGQAHIWCMQRFLEALDRQNPLIVVDNTNVMAWEISPYRQVALAKGHKTQIITLLCDPEVAAERNVHDVDSASIKRMHKQILREHLPKHWEHVIRKNPPHSV